MSILDLHITLIDRSYFKIFSFSRFEYLFNRLPKGSRSVLLKKTPFVLIAASARYVREIPLFAKYFTYTRILTWSSDGRHLYNQTVFTMKGKGGEKRSTEFPSIIPDDEVVCAVLYSVHGVGRKGRKIRAEDVFALDGYDAYDERVQQMREEGWEFVKDLSLHWDKERTLKSTRRLGPRL